MDIIANRDVASPVHSLVKPESASGVVTLDLLSCRGFAANDPRVHRGCSVCSYDGVSERIVYNHFRYYDPSTGRYIQSDRIGLGDGPNTYAYVQQNPLMNYDLLGLEFVARGSFSAAFGVGVNGSFTVSSSGITFAASGVVGIGLSGTFVGGVQASHNPTPEGYGFGLSGGLGGAFNIWGKGNADGKGGIAGGGIGVGLGASGTFKPVNWGISETLSWDTIFDSLPGLGLTLPSSFFPNGLKPKDPCSN